MNPCSLQLESSGLPDCVPGLVFPNVSCFETLGSTNPAALSHARRLGSSNCGNLISHTVYTCIKVSLHVSDKRACVSMLCNILVIAS
jgi:hypothetical protein